MARNKENDAMLNRFAAIMQRQAEENHAQMRDLLKLSQEMMENARRPRGQYFPLRGGVLLGGLSSVYLAIFQTNMEL